MKKTIIKYTIVVIVSIAFIQCKKDAKTDIGKFTYTDENITVSQISENYLMQTEGAFSMSNTGLYGSVAIDLNALDFKYLNTSHILINNKKHLQNITNKVLGHYIYEYPPSLSTPSESLVIQNYFASVYEEAKTDFQLYDTTNNFLVGFKVRNPKLFTLTIDNQNYRTAPAGSRIIVHWNPDASNKLGVAITISGNNGIRYLNFSETGSADITEEALEVGGNDRASVTLSRGVIITGKGSDNRMYKLSNTVSKTEIVYI